MNRIDVINNINNICTYKYDTNIDMYKLFSETCEYSDFISKNVSIIVYNIYTTQLEELYIDAQFGNGLNSENVYNNYIDMLKYICSIL